MMRRNISAAFLSFFLVFGSGRGYPLDSGLFRTVPVTTPQKGVLWVSNTSFYAPITANQVLRRSYGVSDSRILSSLTHASLGLTDRVALTGTIPFYADMFTQGGRSGEKTGPGDVSAGFRVSSRPGRFFLRNFAVGARVTIPEKLGYGAEPLGYRTFSTGVLAYCAEMSLGFDFRLFEGYVSTAYHLFPKAGTPAGVERGDVFYESASGYLGIGKADSRGYSETILQDHVVVTAGAAVPFRPLVSWLIECSTASFTEKPGRSTIVRVAPGVRLGRPDGIHVNAGVDFRIHGPVPSRTYMLQVAIPFLRPKILVGKPLGKEEPKPKFLVRSRNSLVAVDDFTKSDLRFLYERELKNAFRHELMSMGIMDVVDEERVAGSFRRARLVPRKDTPQRLGIRLGANYLINTDISDYSVERDAVFRIPFLFGVPRTTFKLSARASVTDLVSGKTHDLGIISARVVRSRGVSLFHRGGSSDIVYLSEPERRLNERELVDRWVERFNEVILEHLDVFGWEPKRTEIRGDEDTKG